jgi:hypothetical protein
MSRRDDRSTLESLATLGLAVFGPIALFSGLFTFASIPRGVPPAVATIFVISFSAAVLSAALYITQGLRRQ